MTRDDRELSLIKVTNSLPKAGQIFFQGLWNNNIAYVSYVVIPNERAASVWDSAGIDFRSLDLITSAI